MNSLLWIPFYLILIGRIDDSNAVAYGRPVTKGEFKHMAFIMDATTGASCGGAILSNRYVLTAAHCVHCNKVQNIWVVAGTAEISVHKGQKRAVVEKHIHRGFQPMNPNKQSLPKDLCPSSALWKKVAIKNDIAVLKLKTPLLMNAYIAAVALPAANEQFRDIWTWFPGWGLNEHGHEVDHLRSIMLIASSSQRSKENNWPSLENQFDAISGDHHSHTTAGDSGSPFVIGGTVYGVLSTGPTNAFHPSVFTEVYPYIHFIQTAMEKKKRITKLKVKRRS